MNRLTLLASLLVLPVLTQAQAQTPPRPPAALGERGSSDDQKACTGDANRHCRRVLSDGDFAVLRCLQEHRERLTRACQAVLRKHGQ
jgi:hypothetical protein